MSAKKPPRPKNQTSMKMLGKQLGAARRVAGLTQTELGLRVGLDEQTVASIEQGRRALKPDVAARMDEVLETKGMLAAGVANLPDVDQFPMWAEVYMEHEREAIALSWYDNAVLPGLLQTEAYVRAVLRNRVPAYDGDEVETRTAARLERQEILHRRNAPTLSFVVWEPVLLMALGGPEVRTGQLRRLRELAELPCVSLQFLLLSSPYHAGVNGPFILLETPDHQHLAYTESQRGSQWVSDADEVSRLARKYAMLRTQALTTQDSAGLLDRLLGER
ncbi:Scr1 family TA system antitoxin-like transcriptional regulator [Streptomyces sp. NPDC007901]|uniref:helix-turn-helix domain-containing protein n=1 Tax=Streptomyces sp. NPDC007901 TaxID=3364785 RepID=UPI0036EB49E1